MAVKSWMISFMNLGKTRRGFQKLVQIFPKNRSLNIENTQLEYLFSYLS